MTFEREDLWPRYLERWLTLVPTSRSKVKVRDQSSRSYMGKIHRRKAFSDTHACYGATQRHDRLNGKPEFETNKKNWEDRGQTARLTTPTRSGLRRWPWTALARSWQPITSSPFDSPLCSSINPSPFHSRLKPTCFANRPPPWLHLFPGLPSPTIAWTFLLSYSVFVFKFFLIFSFPGRALD